MNIMNYDQLLNVGENSLLKLTKSNNLVLLKRIIIIIITIVLQVPHTLCPLFLTIDLGNVISSTNPIAFYSVMITKLSFKNA